MSLIVIRAAPQDADTARRLERSLRDLGLAARFQGETGEGEERDSEADILIALWSQTSAQTAWRPQHGDAGLLSESIAALRAGSLVLASIDGPDLDGPGGPYGRSSLPPGLRDLPCLSLARWVENGSSEPLEDLRELCDRTLERRQEPCLGPDDGPWGERRADLWNAIALLTGGATSLGTMAAIAASGMIGSAVGSRVWAEALVQAGPEGWIPLVVALGISVLAGVAGWFGALGMFAAGGLLSVRKSGGVANAAPGAKRVALIHDATDVREADVLTLDLRSVGLIVPQNPGLGSGHLRWAAPGVRAAEDADLILLLGTPGTFRSERALREVLAASRRGRPVLPLLFDDTPVPDSFRLALAGRTWMPVDDRLGGVLSPDLRLAIQHEINTQRLRAGPPRRLAPPVEREREGLFGLETIDDAPLLVAAGR